MNGQQWEYRIEAVMGLQSKARFNELGKLGWELVSVNTIPKPDKLNDPITNAYFKRPLGFDPARVAV